MSSGLPSLGSEPVAIITAAVAILQIVQSLAISSISPGVHAIIAVVLVVLGGVLARSAVAPTAGSSPGA